MLLRFLDQAFDQHAWHGTTLAGSVRGVTPVQAMWRPKPNRHNIWELILHAAYWKYVVRRRLTGGQRGGFPREGSDWPKLPATPDAKAWRGDVRLLKEEHQKLRDVVAQLGQAKFATKGATGKWSNAELIHGVAAHDLYHAGQVQLLKRLQRR